MGLKRKYTLPIAIISTCGLYFILFYTILVVWDTVFRYDIELLLIFYIVPVGLNWWCFDVSKTKIEHKMKTLNIISFIFNVNVLILSFHIIYHDAIEYTGSNETFLLIPLYGIYLMLLIVSILYIPIVILFLLDHIVGKKVSIKENII